MMKTYKLKLTALSSIHIGTGEVYEPTNFIIESGKLYEFDEVLFIKSLNKLEKTSLESKLNDYMQVIDFYKNKEIRLKAKTLSFSEVNVSKKVEGKYNTLYNKDHSKNKNLFEIHKTFKNPNTQRAIIPGSSLKGMLDTIFQIYPQKVKDNSVRQKLLLSDAYLSNGGIEIGYSYRKHKNPLKKARSDIPQVIEIIQKNSTFVFTLKTEFSWEDIISSFEKYFAQSSRENYFFQTTNNSFVARVGKFSGKAFMVDDGKNVLNNDRKPIATHTLYEDESQFGWVNIELIDDNKYEQALAEISLKEQEYFSHLNQRQQEVRQRILEIKHQKQQATLEKKLKEEAEAKAQKEAKHKEQEALSRMSPFEKRIYELEKNHPNKAETLDIIILNALKNGILEDEFRCKALIKVKEEMIKHKKWVEVSKAKKPEKDKKYKKTQEIIKMLENCSKKG